MADPATFQVVDVKNPWMVGNRNKIKRDRAIFQWESLKTVIEGLVGQVRVLKTDLPLEDIVFAANCGVVGKNKQFIVSNMVHPGRQKESPLYSEFMAELGYKVLKLPKKHQFEGQGDALWHPNGKVLFGGYGSIVDGHRTDLSTYFEIQKLWSAIDIIPIKLINKSFYHLDTCFAPLNKKVAMLYEKAFTPDSVDLIADNFETLIPVSKEDARKFACNAVVIDKTVILNQGISEELKSSLQTEGFRVIEVDLSEFMKSGGSAACMVIKLS